MFYTQITYLPTFLDHFSSSLKPSTISLPDSITLGSHNTPFSDSAGNLGFILDSQLSMKKYIIKICQTAYFELKRTSSIHRFLTEVATKTLLPISSHGLTTATVSSWVHLILSSNLYRKFRALLQDLFSWHPITTTPLLEKLHWLPISECIKCKVTCMCFNTINGSGLAYLSELLHVYTLSCTLCFSSDTHILKIQQ